MVQKQIEQEYEEVIEKTDTETVTFCDGCTEEAPGHVVLSNISVNCLEQAAGSATDVQRLLDNAEEFHICAGCQKGLREHGRVIDTSLYDAPDHSSTETLGDTLNGFDDGATLAGFGVGLLSIFVGLISMLTAPAGGVALIFLGVMLVITAMASPHNFIDHDDTGS